MRRTLLPAALLLAATTALPVSAGPEADGPTGALCSLYAVGTSWDTYSGVLTGGPVAVVDDANNPGDGELRCTIQVGPNHAHSYPDSASRRAANVGVVTLLPATVSFRATIDQNIYLCSQFTYDGGSTVYWHADNDDDPSTDTGHWSNDAFSECALAMSASTPEDLPVLCDVGFCVSSWHRAAFVPPAFAP
jgi:hypothetical protein